MDGVSFILAGVAVYVAVAVFIGGSVYKLYQWVTTPRSTVRLGMFPRPEKRFGRGLKLVKDTLLFPQVMDNDRIMWIFVIMLHLVGLATFFGHMRLFGEFGPLINLIGTGTMNTLSFIGGGTAGIVLLVTTLYLLVRRFKSPYRDISVPEDYLLLLLILLIIMLGNHLRFFAHFDVADYQVYMNSLVAFKPDFPAAIAQSGARWVLVGHVFTASLLLMYFPFSKLVHFFGSFASNLVRSD